MAYISINATRNSGGAIEYVLNPKVKNKERVLAMRGSNVVADNALEQMHSTREAYLKNGINANTGEQYLQAYRLKQSFGTNELDPTNSDDIEKCNLLGYELAQKAFPNNEALVVTHGDGAGGKLHNHIIINATSFKDGKQLRGNQKEWKTLVRLGDEVLRENGMTPTESPFDSDGKRIQTGKGKTTMAEVKLRAQGKYVWKDDLKARIQGVLDAGGVRSLDEFMTAMQEEEDITVNKRGKKENLSYSFVDELGKKRKSTAKVLGGEFQIDGVKAVFEKNIEAQAVVARPELPSKGISRMSSTEISEYMQKKAKYEEWESKRVIVEKTPKVEVNSNPEMIEEAVRTPEEQALFDKMMSKYDVTKPKVEIKDVVEAPPIIEVVDQQQQQSLINEREEERKAKEKADKAIEQRNIEIALQQQAELARKEKERERKELFIKDVKNVKRGHKSINSTSKESIGYVMQAFDGNRPLTSEEERWYKEYKEPVEQKRQPQEPAIKRDDLEL